MTSNTIVMGTVVVNADCHPAMCSMIFIRQMEDTPFMNGQLDILPSLPVIIVACIPKIAIIANSARVDNARICFDKCMTRF